jgi:protein-S-isoprenylcysteine O-methyltransferase Ste14
VAALAPKPRDRIHFAVKFAAGAMRVAAILVVLLAIGGSVALFNLPSIPGAQGLSIEPLVAIVVATLAVVLGLILALILWGFADALVLLADVDDAQRETQRQLADVILAQRSDRGPFHAEVVARKEKTSA